MIYAVAALTLALIVGAIYAVWRRSEEQKAESRRFEQRMKASLGPAAQWPVPRGKKTPWKAVRR